MIFLYVKLVGDNVCHLLELPEVNIPMGTHCPLGIKYKKTPATFEVTGVCKRIEFYGVGVI